MFKEESCGARTRATTRGTPIRQHDLLWTLVVGCCDGGSVGN